jgi:hypothetical protein
MCDLSSSVFEVYIKPLRLLSGLDANHTDPEEIQN